MGTQSKRRKKTKKQNKMAKAVSLVSVLCILAFATVAHCHAPEVFNVEGDVYCDPCRVQFETKLSHKIAGAPLKLECNVPMAGLETARIVCTENSGMHNPIRYANALGFMTKDSVSGCKEVLDELGLAPKDLDL